MSEPRGIPAGLEPKLTKAISEFFARTYDGESEADVLIDIIADAILADRAELDRLREALEEIVKPVEFMRRRADAAGSKLDGFMAITLAKDPEYLRGIARAALSPDNSTQKKEGEI